MTAHMHGVGLPYANGEPCPSDYDCSTCGTGRFAHDRFDIRIPATASVRFYPGQRSTVIEFASAEAAIAFRDRVCAEINVGAKASETAKRRGRDLAQEHGW